MIKRNRSRNKFSCPFTDGRVCSDCFYFWEGECSLDRNLRKKVKPCATEQAKLSKSSKKK
jgi:hypothetical protein